MSLVVQIADFEPENVVREVAAPSRGLRAKRVFDVAVGGLLILALLPVFVLIALGIRADGGQILFRHRRIGAGGKPFMCLKFRSMRPDADAALAAYFASNPDAEIEWRQTHKLRHDPRVTAMGRLLRASSLDELPQLFNVIAGDMSLVGPRPITAAEAARYGGMMRFYCAGKPGITGLWQVSGRSSTSYERRIELDVDYVTNWAFRRDIAILARTIPAVLLRRGAC